MEGENPATSAMPVSMSIASFPRRTIAVPNHDGNFILLRDSYYHPQSGLDTAKTQIMRTSDGELFIFAVGEPVDLPFWLEGTTLLWTRSRDDVTHVLLIDAADPNHRTYLAGCLPLGASQLRTQMLTGEVFALTYVLQRDTIPIRQAKTSSGSGRLYDSLPVRFGSSYPDPANNRSTIWLTTLEKRGSDFHISDSRPKDVLQGTNLVFTPWLLADTYDICLHGLIVRAIGPGFDKIRTFSAELYYVPVNWARGHMSRAQKLGQPDWTGMPSSFCISPHGEFAIYLQSESSNSCFDHDSIFIVQLNQPQTAHKVELLSADRQWQPRLLSVQWSFIDNKVVYAIIDDRANASVWKISLKESGSGWQGAACRLICAGRTTSVSPFVTAQGHENLLLHRSTFDATGVVEIMTLPADSEPEVRLISELRFEASHASHEQVFFPGSGDYEVQAFVHKPDTFREGSKYPIVVLVHGGPNDAWRDCWSTVWNPLLWTDQGYVVVTPNISGSTGFGLAYARSIYQNWGGRPYSDIDSLFSFIEKSMPYVDLTRVVGAGFSFGGYMMNWIAGHGTSDRFCALIVHGGVYSVRNLLSSDIPTVYPADFGGLPWEVPEVWDRWDPSRYSDAWKTPMLFTHGDLDYRVPITEAFAAFQACQLRRIPSRFLVFPNEGHAIRKPANLAQWHEEMVEWSLNWTRVDTDKCANLCIGDLRENADP